MVNLVKVIKIVHNQNSPQSKWSNGPNSKLTCQFGQLTGQNGLLTGQNGLLTSQFGQLTSQYGH